MVLFVMGFVALSLWAVIVDTLGPVTLNGSRAASVGCFFLACIFLLQVWIGCLHTIRLTVCQRSLSSWSRFLSMPANATASFTATLDANFSLGSLGSLMSPITYP